MSRIIHSWKKISLVEQDVTLPTGATLKHTTITHPGATVILPVNRENQIIILRQYRPSIAAWLYELPAGTMETGESPLECAQRELGEEAGLTAKTWTALGQITPLAGFCNEVQHLFLAKDLIETDAFQQDEDEVIEVETFSLAALEQKIISNEITDAKTIACLSRAKLCGYLSE
ncbi:ADP-ribose pyrophosphatase [Vibrio aerogenes CECT 7868]|uniref:GDP-mannose pyrophosphatase n=1 Tax=Vibrio aerogenes CECT 7868 TaxID=1216006 RepID=A0A1M5ZW44_9VIBR|nr:NUDIX hydrolase [Vibrio aerogenes]SHI28143.1 ADP-ribose pyrophosphatase [Vibrio aerogenes CECT 7868]